jgi:hypothetical protein
LELFSDFRFLISDFPPQALDREPPSAMLNPSPASGRRWRKSAGETIRGFLMTTLPTAVPPCCELLESRVLLSGAGDLVHTVGPELTPHLYVVSASNGGKALFAGGWGFGNPDNPYSPVVDVYDSATRQWSMAYLSEPKVVDVAVTVRGKTFFASVYQGANGQSATLDIYDGTTGAFTASNLPHSTLYSVAASAGGKALFAGNDVGTQTADTLNPATGELGTVLLPVKVSGPPAAAVTVGNWTLIVSLFGANLFDITTGRWTGIDIPFSPSVGPMLAAGAGSKAFFIDDSGKIAIYDFTTRRWTSAHLPVPRFAVSMAAVGSKVIFAGGIRTFTNDPNSPSVDRVDVYDITTGRWSRATLAVPASLLSAATAGRTAIFAFGTAFGGLSGVKPELFTDTAPASLFTGSLTGKPGEKAKLTIFNTGDADLTGPYTVEVYASTDRTLKGAIPLGKLRVNGPLAAGASVSLQIPTALPRLPRGGNFYLLAAVVEGTGRRTAVAASAAAFHVKPAGAAWG